MSKSLKIIFAGTPEIARMVLANILTHDFNVELVLTQPDRPAGRGMKLTPSPVKELALQHGIEVFQPVSFKKSPEAMDKIRALQPDIMIVVAYGLILPQELLDIPKMGCINIHVSLLPKWRGAAPIQRAVLAGDKESGVTIMQMDAGLDTGDMLLVEKIALESNETSLSLHDKLAKLGAEKIIDYLNNLDKYPPIKQSSEGVSYAHKLTKEEAAIDWSEHADVIARKIRGYNPFPGAYSFLEGVLHKFWGAEGIDKKTAELAGTILNAKADELTIACGDGSILRVTELQEAGSKRKSSSQYIQGKSNLIGKKFDGVSK